MLTIFNYINKIKPTKMLYKKNNAKNQKGYPLNPEEER